MVVTREHYEAVERWRLRYIDLLEEFAAVNNRLLDEQDYLKKQVKKLSRRNIQLEAENWQLKHRHRR